MGILFISHSSRNNDEAIVIRDWLRDNGWNEIFLDLDPERGLVPGHKWQEELKRAGEQCSAVVLLISPDWVASKWCNVEALLASQLGKRIFGVVVEPTPFEEMPIELTAIYQLVDISDSETREDGLDRLRHGLIRAGLDPKHFPWPPPGEPDRSPYRGLRSLEIQDAGIFFGREAAITKGLDMLRRLRGGAPERMMVILGASGAGKSSFLKAGLLARLERDPANFLVLPVVRPERAALTGPQGLLRTLDLSEVPEEDELRIRLEAIRRPEVEQLRRYAEAGDEVYKGEPPTLILPIDQGEELFGSSNAESVEALELVRKVIAADENLVVILTIRSDSFSRLQSEPHLAEIPRLPFDLPRLSPGAFKEVIEGPGQLAEPEIRVEPALTDRLLKDLDTADALPLLAFTMERLVAEYGDDGMLELDEFVEGLGGLEGAIDRAVDLAFDEALRDPALPNDRGELEALTRKAFIPWLVTVDDAEAPPRRRVARMEEVPAEARGLVRLLVDQRLLVSDEKDGETHVEVSHDAVLRHWQGVTVWTEEECDALLTLSSVQTATTEWNRHEETSDSGSRDTWLVHRGERLAAAEVLVARPDYRQILGETGEAYLKACRARENKQLERQVRLQRLAMIFLLLFILAVSSFAAYTVRQARGASREMSLVLADSARRAINEGYPGRGARFASLAAREGPLDVAHPAAAPTLAAAAHQSPLIMELRGHQGPVVVLEISPDRMRFLTRGLDNTVRVWDADSGEEIAAMRHEGDIVGALFDGEGFRVLSWSLDGVARVWDAGSGEELARTQHESEVRGAVFNGDGSRVLSWGKGGVARVWGVSSGSDIAEVKVDDAVWGVAFSIEGDRALFLGRNGVARVWSASAGEEIAEVKHQGEILGGTFSLQADRVLTWGRDRVARVWNASTGEELAATKHQGGVLGAAFDAQGDRVLSWGLGGFARVWDASSGEPIAATKHDGWVERAVFDARGDRILSWSKKVVRVWNANSGELFATKGHRDGLRGAAFSGKGERIVSWDENGIARVWDANSGQEVAATRHEGSVGGATFNDESDRVLSWDEAGIARVWNAGAGDEIGGTKHDGEVRFSVFAAEGAGVLSWGADGVVRFWNASLNREITTTKHRGPVLGAAFTHEGDRVLSWGTDGIVRVWDALSGKDMSVTQHKGWARGAEFDDDGERVLSWGSDGIAWVWDARTGGQIASTYHDAVVRGGEFTDEGDRVVSWDEAGVVRVWVATSGEQIASINHGDKAVRGAAFGVAGDRVLSWGEDGEARVWNASSGEEIAARTHGGRVGGAVFDERGDRVLSWGEDGIARVWDSASGEVIAAIQHEHWIWDAEFDDEGQRALSCDEHGVVRVWDANSGEQIVAARHAAGVRGAAFDADGGRVLSWSVDGEARIWDASSGEEIAATSHAGRVRGARFDGRGSRILSWGEEGIARVWNATTGEELAEMQHEDEVWGAAFDAEADRVLSWGRDGTVRIWDVSWTVPRPSNRALIDEVCEKKLRGPETELREPFVNGNGDLITHNSVRRISRADAEFAPILRDRIGEDVCAPPTWGERLWAWWSELQFSRKQRESSP